MTDWFRSWHGAPTDPKWLLIAKRANVRPIHVSGTWWALLDHASQHSERGFVGDFDVETFALFAGMEEEHVSRIVTALRDKGLIVEDRIGQWLKRQPKREDDGAADRQRRHRANSPKNGGNPPSGRTPDTPDSTTLNGRHAMSRNVTPDKKRGEESVSVADATGTVVPHPASDFCKAVFDAGIALLVEHGRTERDARSVVGRWRKSCGDAELMILLRESETKSSRLEWLMAAVETRNGKRNRTDIDGHGTTVSSAVSVFGAPEREEIRPQVEALRRIGSS